VQICAWLDDSIFAQIAPDKKIDDVPYFSDGTGIADSKLARHDCDSRIRAHNYFDDSRRRTISDQAGFDYISKLSQGKKN
jgi:hypothetical protein